LFKDNMRYQVVHTTWRKPLKTALAFLGFNAFEKSNSRTA